MNITSEPKYEVITVTDIDIAFPGDTQARVVMPGDTLTESGARLTLTFATGGEMVFDLSKAHWYAKRQRQMRVLAPEPVRADG